MKKIVIVLFVILLTLTSACNNTPIENEVDNTINDNEPAIDKEEIVAVAETSYDKVGAFMKEECENVFSPYYELLDFEISNYEEEVVNGNVEATFFYTVTCKNYDKDPDTVAYIKEAKESGNENYQQMYDEYLQPREMNFHLKAVVDESDSITLYSNISPNGVEWEETKMTDFILSE